MSDPRSCPAKSGNRSTLLRMPVKESVEHFTAINHFKRKCILSKKFYAHLNNSAHVHIHSINFDVRIGIKMVWYFVNTLPRIPPIILDITGTCRSWNIYFCSI